MEPRNSAARHLAMFKHEIRRSDSIDKRVEDANAAARNAVGATNAGTASDANQPPQQTEAPASLDSALQPQENTSNLDATA